MCRYFLLINNMFILFACFIFITQFRTEKIDSDMCCVGSREESSSFDSFKRLRLLMSLLIEPKATKTMAASQEA